MQASVQYYRVYLHFESSSLNFNQIISLSFNSSLGYHVICFSARRFSYNLFQESFATLFIILN